MTVALVFNREFTREQFDALTAVFWAFPDWRDGGTVVFPSGLEVTARVEPVTRFDAKTREGAP